LCRNSVAHTHTAMATSPRWITGRELLTTGFENIKQNSQQPH
jgi:hypothetical protein